MPALGASVPARIGTPAARSLRTAAGGIPSTLSAPGRFGKVDSSARALLGGKIGRQGLIRDQRRAARLAADTLQDRQSWHDERLCFDCEGDEVIIDRLVEEQVHQAVGALGQRGAGVLERVNVHDGELFLRRARP